MERGFSYKVYISEALTVASLNPFVYMNCGLWFGFFFTTLPKRALQIVAWFFHLLCKLSVIPLCLPGRSFCFPAPANQALSVARVRHAPI